MRNQEKFLLNEIPWEELKSMGITEKAFLDLPKDAIERIMTGNNSPLMKLTFTNNEGKTVQVPAKFRIERMADGEVQVLFQPKRNNLENNLDLTPDEILRMKNQETIRKTVMTEKGNVRCYLQMDHELNTIEMVEEQKVKIPEAIGHVVLGETEKQQIREGKPVELEINDTKVTVGVDLNARSGFRVVDGDMGEWRQKKLEQWDRITPGANGYWHTSENGWEYQNHLNRNEQVQQQMSQGRGMRR